VISIELGLFPLAYATRTLVLALLIAVLICRSSDYRRDRCCCCCCSDRYCRECDIVLITVALLGDCLLVSIIVPIVRRLSFARLLSRSFDCSCVGRLIVLGGAAEIGHVDAEIAIAVTARTCT